MPTPVTPTKLPLWAGRSIALIGILLVAVNLRTGVATISPIIRQIDVDIPLDSITLGIIGAVPPVLFAVSGLVTGIGAKRFGLERVAVAALLIMVVGALVRASALNVAGLLAGSILALLGAGIGNVLLPPLIKRYFPDRIGLMTSAYVTIMAVGSGIPPLVAAPIADSLGWRVSIGMWAGLAAVALIPWAALLLTHSRARALLAAGGDEAPELDEPRPQAVERVWRSKIAWTIVALFSLSSAHTYAMFAWLPEILHDLAGTTAAQGGALVALFGVTGAPLGLFIPLLVVRSPAKVHRIIYIGLAAFFGGYLGLLLAPSPLSWLWVVLLGSGPILFTTSLTLVNLRSRTHEGAVALSAFVQGAAYTIGALGPIVIGLLHDLTGGWLVPIGLLMVTIIACAFAARRAARPEYVEDELAARDRQGTGE